MNKQDFLEKLRNGLTGLPQSDIDERLNFYIEMIDDRMEEGLTEEEAVAAVGTVEDIVAQIKSDIPLAKLVKEKIRPKRALRTWEIVLIILGFPIWFSLLIAVVSVVFAFYIVIWSLMVALWAVEAAVVMCSVAEFAYGSVYIAQGNLWTGMAMLSAAMVCMGISIFFFIGCQQADKGVVLLSKKIFNGLKSCFIGKRG